MYNRGAKISGLAGAFKIFKPLLRSYVETWKQRVSALSAKAELKLNMSKINPTEKSIICRGKGMGCERCTYLSGKAFFFFLLSLDCVFDNRGFVN